MPIRRFSSRLRALALAVATVGSLIAMTARAERLESPLELIYAPDAMLVAGPIVEINPKGRIVVERKDVLSGKEKPAEKIDVRVPVEILGSVTTGERCIVAYSDYRRDTRKAVGLVRNPDGAVALVSTGIEPALFRDTPEARAILKAGRSEHGRESRRLRDLLLDALGSNDGALAYLAAGELALEPELGERLTDENRAAIEKTVRNVKTPERVRRVLLEASSRNPKELGAFSQSAALDIVTTTPVDGYSDKASDPVSLVLTALEVLDRYGTAIPPDALKRWVWNPNPPLVERVCVMLRRVAPAEERSTIQLALADPKLPEQTRKFLNDHLRRLDRLDAKVKARKEGSG